MPRIDNDVKLDFKDVLLRPKRSTLKSRADVSINFPPNIAMLSCIILMSSAIFKAQTTKLSWAIVFHNLCFK